MRLRFLRFFGKSTVPQFRFRFGTEPVCFTAWRAYCARAWPLRHGADGDGRRRSATAADFARCSLPTCAIEMVVRRLRSARTQQFLAGRKAQWTHETRRGCDVPADEPFLLHPALTHVRTADGGGSISAVALGQYSARIHFVLRRAFPSEPNANEAGVVVTAHKAAVCVMWASMRRGVLKELPTPGYVSFFLNHERNWSAVYLAIPYPGRESQHRRTFYVRRHIRNSGSVCLVIP